MISIYKYEQYNVCVEIYFLFLIFLCVSVLLATVVVVRLYLRADAEPLVAMPDWVRRHRKLFVFYNRYTIHKCIIYHHNHFFNTFS